MDRFISLETARTLVQQGLMLTPHYSYLVQDEKGGIAHTSFVNLCVSAGQDTQHYPACTFEELWPLLPYKLTIDGEECGLHLQGKNMFGQYIAQYYRYPTMRSRLSGAVNATTPVEAAGTLLLEVLRKGLVTADQINQVQERLNAA